MNIGETILDSRSAILAPMAGVADRAFREICVGYGASYVVSEMVSAKGLVMGDRKSKRLLSLSGEEHPAAVQIFGDDPDIMAKAVPCCLEAKPQAIDINMGCPAPKIAGNGGGASLMRNPEKAEAIVKAVVSAADVPVTVKIRAGWDSDSINAVELAQRAERAGASAITVHGRTRQQMYAPPVNKEIITLVKQSVRIPVIGNGDVTDGLSAAQMLAETGCDCVMVGRGALGRPWVFAQIRAFLNHEAILPEPPVSERMRVMVRHIEKLCEYKGERIGINEARKHAAWYIKGIRGAAAYRREVGTLSSIDQLRRIAYEICCHASE